VHLVYTSFFPVVSPLFYKGNSTCAEQRPLDGELVVVAEGVFRFAAHDAGEVDELRVVASAEVGDVDPFARRDGSSRRGLTGDLPCRVAASTDD